MEFTLKIHWYKNFSVNLKVFCFHWFLSWILFWLNVRSFIIPVLLNTRRKCSVVCILKSLFNIFRIFLINIVKPSFLKNWSNIIVEYMCMKSGLSWASVAKILQDRRSFRYLEMESSVDRCLNCLKWIGN